MATKKLTDAVKGTAPKKATPAAEAIEAMATAPEQAKEQRTVKGSLLLPPTLAEDINILLQHISRKRGKRQSLNDYIVQLLQAEVDKPDNREIISKYKELL